MKKIIRGHTLNTDTATLIHQTYVPDGQLTISLYQALTGVCFLCWEAPDVGMHSVKVCSYDQAVRWLARYGAQYKGKIVQQEKGARLTLRVPAVLYHRLTNMARTNEKSMNSLAIRLLEKGLE